MAILRCRLKGITTSDTADYASISVDIIRKKNRNYHNITTRNHDQSSAIISFSVPWHARFVGYGFNFNNSSSFDPWSLREGEPKTHVCTSLHRPLNPMLSIVGIPMILEYIEHYLLLGVDHIFVPILLDWNSRYMQRYMIALKSYILSGSVSIVSLALKGHDDISGFNGIHINNLLAERIFMNTCIYMSKGSATYVITSKANQFMVPMLDNFHTKYHYYLNKSSKSTRRNLEGISSTSRFHGNQIRSSTRDKATKKRTSGNSDIEYCAYFIASFILPEPENTNHFVHGAGDDAWSVDYYKTSVLNGPHIDQGVHVLLSDNIHSWKDDKFSCQPASVSSFHRENKLIFTNYTAITNRISTSSLSVIQYGWDNFQQRLLTITRTNNSDLIKFKEQYWTQSVEKLKVIGFDTIDSIKQLKKVSDATFTAKVNIPVGRASMKPPFWLILDKVNLRQVLTNRYGAK